MIASIPGLSTGESKGIQLTRQCLEFGSQGDSSRLGNGLQGFCDFSLRAKILLSAIVLIFYLISFRNSNVKNLIFVKTLLFSQ